MTVNKVVIKWRYDPRTCWRILSNCLMNLKNSGDSTEFEPMTSAMPVHCSNQQSYEVTQLRTGQFVGPMFSHERNVVWRMSNKVVQMKYNFDTSDPPNGTFEHSISKNFWGECPQTRLKVRALRALGRVPSPPWPPPSSQWPTPTNLFEKADGYSFFYQLNFQQFQAILVVVISGVRDGKFYQLPV